ERGRRIATTARRSPGPDYRIGRTGAGRASRATVAGAGQQIPRSERARAVVNRAQPISPSCAGQCRLFETERGISHAIRNSTRLAVMGVLADLPPWRAPRPPWLFFPYTIEIRPNGARASGVWKPKS